jgi:hypothetical protein
MLVYFTAFSVSISEIFYRKNDNLSQITSAQEEKQPTQKTAIFTRKLVKLDKNGDHTNSNTFNASNCPVEATKSAKETVF